jgi:hypothetical protein
MDWSSELGSIIQKYSGAGGGAAAAPASVHQDFEQAAQKAPREVTASAVEHALRSDQTRSFPQMVSALFDHADPNQRAGLLSHLLGAIGGGGIAGIPGLSALPGILGEGTQQVTPEQAARVPSNEVARLAEHAQGRNPGAVTEISRFVSEHPGVMKALGGAVAMMAMRHIASRL